MKVKGRAMKKMLWIPTLSGLLSGGSAWYWSAYPVFPDAAAVSSFGGTVASISTTMLGFLLAALAVLASISHTHLLTVMREHGHYKDLLQTMLVGFLFFMVCAVCGFTLLFGYPLSNWLGCVLVGVHVAAFVSLLDVGRKMWLVLMNLK